MWVQKAPGWFEPAAPLAFDARDGLLHHHPDLLRQRGAAPRARLLDDRGRHHGPPHAPARRGRVLPHGHGRARRAGRAGRRARGRDAEGAGRPQRRALPGAAAADQRQQRLLHPHLRSAPPRAGPGGHAADPRQRPHVQGPVRGLVLPALRGLQDRDRDRAGPDVPDPQDPARPRARGELVLQARELPGAAREAVRGQPRLGSARGTRYNEARSFITGGLQDVSLSRSKTKLTWGVQVPWDEQHVFYVWFDALLNYYTALSFARDGEDLTDTFWPATFHFLAQGHPQVPRRDLAGDAARRRHRAAAQRVHPRLPADEGRVGRRAQDVQVARQRARPVRGHGHVRHRRAPLLLLPRGLVRAGRRRVDDHVRRALRDRARERVRQPRQPHAVDDRPLPRRRRAGDRRRPRARARTSTACARRSAGCSTTRRSRRRSSASGSACGGSTATSRSARRGSSPRTRRRPASSTRRCARSPTGLRVVTSCSSRTSRRRRRSCSPRSAPRTARSTTRPTAQSRAARGPRSSPPLFPQAADAERTA